MDGLAFPTILVDKSIWLERAFEEKIYSALSDYVGDKAPGPDDFNFSFIKEAWDLLMEDFCEMLAQFHIREG